MVWTLTFTLFPPHRGPPRSSSSDPDFVVVDGVPVMLPTYDEAVSGGSSALGPGYLASVGQGCPLPVDDQSPPAYPGSGDTDTGPGESETCDSTSGSSELLQSLYSASMCQGGSHPAPDTPDTVSSTAGEVASTSPGIDIADGKLQLAPQHRVRTKGLLLTQLPLLLTLSTCRSLDRPVVANSGQYCASNKIPGIEIS